MLRRRSGREERREVTRRRRNWVAPSAYLRVRDALLEEDDMAARVCVFLAGEEGVGFVVPVRPTRGVLEDGLG